MNSTHSCEFTGDTKNCGACIDEKALAESKSENETLKTIRIYLLDLLKIAGCECVSNDPRPDAEILKNGLGHFKGCPLRDRLCIICSEPAMKTEFCKNCLVTRLRDE